MEYLTGGVKIIANCSDDPAENRLFGDLVIDDCSFAGARNERMIVGLFEFNSFNNVTLSNSKFYTYFSVADSFEFPIIITTVLGCMLDGDDGRPKIYRVQNNTFKSYPNNATMPRYSLGMDAGVAGDVYRQMYFYFDNIIFDDVQSTDLLWVLQNYAHHPNVYIRNHTYRQVSMEPSNLLFFGLLGSGQLSDFLFEDINTGTLAMLYVINGINTVLSNITIRNCISK